ncbi:OmpA family protein [Poseidonibacter lekithochrous]|uniref:OmpA family protein n=1 Tax=Poseidonibacter TaxID=2321187 RepID=UPI001C0A078C|nr:MULTISPECIES: OmpA family protein [Poseidonibacter]MBU3013424.1 OmpA family protein [Poseidonibacter lekithochrous]MDO6826721.1 OmpA family protein [Poseidonibacter sp. 1_MG-2023]
MYDKKQSNEENFWISYADLMAGLLFVFILVIGAIIIKYLYAQTDLKVIKTNLQEQKDALNLSEEELLNKKKKLNIVNTQLQKIQEEKIHLSFELAKSKNMFNETKLQLEEEKILANKLNQELETKNKNLAISTEQIEKITAILEDKENNIKLLNKNLEDERNILLEKTSQIHLNNEEIDKLKALLFDYELQVKEQKDTNTELSTKFENQKNMISLKDEELLMLENKILIQSKLHQKLVEEFDITKVKIKHLTGIKITVISKLKDKLGKSINIDEKSGAITFSSNILFDQGEYTLKEESKKELSLVLKKYLQALLDDESIRKYIHSITIEGHTNSDGSYLDNLALSQQRALEVMQFLYTSQIVDKALLEKYVNASGRSYSDIIYKNGVEDKDNSRRIEIKFRIKNETAIKELQNFLGNKK